MLKGIMKLNKQEGVDVAALTAELASTKETLEASVAELTAAQEQIATMTAQYEEAVKALAELKDVKAAMEKEAEEKRMSARKQKISAAVGDSKVESLMAATMSLSDEAFDEVVGAMSASVEKESKTEMFVEKGVTAEVDASKVASEKEEDLLTKMLQEKYHTK